MKIIEQLKKQIHNNEILKNVLRPIWMTYKKIILWRQNRNLQKNGYNVLSKFSSICYENQIPFWLEFGTLLGAYREKGFIKHDLDMDFGIFYEDLDKIQKKLNVEGFKLIRKFACDNDVDGIELTYRFDNVSFDIFVFHHLNDSKMKCNSFTLLRDSKNNYTGYASVKEIYFDDKGIEPFVFNGILVGVPKDIENHLKLNYGDNFMTPDRNFDYKKVATNIKYIPVEDRIARYFEL